MHLIGLKLKMTSENALSEFYREKNSPMHFSKTEEVMSLKTCCLIMRITSGILKTSDVQVTFLDLV